MCSGREERSKLLLFFHKNFRPLITSCCMCVNCSDYRSGRYRFGQSESYCCRILVKSHWNYIEIKRNQTEITVKSSEIKLKSCWNYSEITLKSHWNYSRTSIDHTHIVRIVLRSWSNGNCSFHYEIGKGNEITVVVFLLSTIIWTFGLNFKLQKKVKVLNCVIWVVSYIVHLYIKVNHIDHRITLMNIDESYWSSRDCMVICW